MSLSIAASAVHIPSVKAMMAEYVSFIADGSESLLVAVDIEFRYFR